jgi:hypothetical protein
MTALKKYIYIYSAPKPNDVTFQNLKVNSNWLT